MILKGLGHDLGFKLKKKIVYKIVYWCILKIDQNIKC